MSRFLCFIVPLIISLILIIPVKYIAIKCGLYAKENERTVHHGKIPRIGGVAIFLAFLIGCKLFIKDNIAFEGIILGGVVIFVEGLIDDALAIKPIMKILAQVIAATILVFVGKVYLTTINLPFGITLQFKFFNYVITYIWIIGITNAMNLIDGLDGLCGGFSVIVLLTICFLSPLIHRSYITPLCLILAGSTMGFLFYNFHPASIFMGDCGSQFLGYMIAAISLFGFKSTTFITLAVPVMLLFVPIMDTFLAIIRRKLNHKRISDPDKGHLHHKLMFDLKLGQTGSVLVIYAIATLFGVTSYLYVVNPTAGFCMLLFLIILFDLFIEYTSMISKNYRPILNLFDKIINANKK